MSRKPSQQVFEIYTHPQKPGAPVILPTGFSFFAFFLHGFWLIYHGAWRVGIGLLVLIACLHEIALALNIADTLRLLAELSLQCWVGFEAYNLRGLDARLRGYMLSSVIVARDVGEAEYFALDEWCSRSSNPLKAIS